MLKLKQEILLPSDAPWDTKKQMIKSYLGEDATPMPQEVTQPQMNIQPQGNRSRVEILRDIARKAGER